jgi:hypothetical protein
MKKCKKCLLEKELVEFNKLKNSKDGLRNQCKSCEKVYRDMNSEKMKNYLKEYYFNNKESLKEINRSRYDERKDIYNEERRNRYQNDEDTRNRILEAGKNYRDNNKDKVLESKKRYYYENKEYVSDWKKNYYLLIKDTTEYKDRRNKNMLNWSKNNPHIVAWRNSLRRVLLYLDIEKSSKTIDILGYSADEFKYYIEEKFSEGMSWDNWGEWHIDHIIPVSKFDKDSLPSEVNALSNLQPLWSLDNLKKGNRI